MADRVKQLSGDLSRMLNDQTAWDADGKEYSSALRLLALNKAEGDMVRDIASKPVALIMGEFSDLLEIVRVTFNFTMSRPAGYARTVALNKVSPEYTHFVWCTPLEYSAIAGSYNKEDTADYGAEKQYHWTEIGGKIYVIPAIGQFFDNVDLLLLKDHVDLTYEGADDFIFSSRYDKIILMNAYEFIIKLLPNG